MSKAELYFDFTEKVKNDIPVLVSGYRRNTKCLRKVDKYLKIHSMSRERKLIAPFKDCGTYSKSV